MKPAAVAAAATAALVLAPSAVGHGSVRPTLAEPGSTEQFTFEVLNARDTPMVGFGLVVPPGAYVVDVPAKPGWRASEAGGIVEWRGSAPAHGSASFAVRVGLPDSEGTVSFTAVELFPAAAGPQFHLDVVLAKGGRTNGGGLGETAAIVAVAGGVLLVAAALLVRRRRAA